MIAGLIKRMDKKSGINPIFYRIDVSLSYINIIPQNKKSFAERQQNFCKIKVLRNLTGQHEFRFQLLQSASVHQKSCRYCLPKQSVVL